MLYPSGSVVGTSTVTTFSSAASQAASVPYSAPYSSYAAAPSSSAYGCDIGDKPCGSVCIPLSYTCCPQQQGGCPISDTCVLRTDGEDACCPIGSRCNDVVYSSSSAGFMPFSSSYYDVPLWPSSTSATSATPASPSYGVASFTAGSTPSQTFAASAASHQKHTNVGLWRLILGLLGLSYYGL